MTVDELLRRMSAQELAEWQYVLGKEHQIGALMRDGVDAEIAQRVVFEQRDED